MISLFDTIFRAMCIPSKDQIFSGWSPLGGGPLFVQQNCLFNNLTYGELQEQVENWGQVSSARDLHTRCETMRENMACPNTQREQSFESAKITFFTFIVFHLINVLIALMQGTKRFGFDFPKNTLHSICVLFSLLGMHRGIEE